MAQAFPVKVATAPLPEVVLFFKGAAHTVLLQGCRGTGMVHSPRGLSGPSAAISRSPTRMEGAGERSRGAEKLRSELPPARARRSCSAGPTGLEARRRREEMGGKRQQRVLVVDEDKGHCMQIRRLLSKDFEGLIVDVAQDADAALKLLIAGGSSASASSCSSETCSSPTCADDYDLVLLQGPQISGRPVVDFVHLARSLRQLLGGKTLERSYGRAWQSRRDVEFAAAVETVDEAIELDRLAWSEVAREGHNILTKPVSRTALRALVGAALVERARRNEVFEFQMAKERILCARPLKNLDDRVSVGRRKGRSRSTVSRTHCLTLLSPSLSAETERR